MSGRKDYTYVLSAARAASRLAAARRRQAERAAKTRERLRKQELVARQKAANLRKAQQQKTMERLGEAKQKAEATLANYQATLRARRSHIIDRGDQSPQDNCLVNEADQPATNRAAKNEMANLKKSTEESVNAASEEARSNADERQTDAQGTVEAHLAVAKQIVERALELGIEDERVVKEAASIAARTLDLRDEGAGRLAELMDQLSVRCAEQERLNDEYTSCLEKLIGWRSTLGDDEDVRHFARAEFEQWTKGADSLLSRIDEQLSVRDHLASLQSLIVQAESIHEKAGEVSGKFVERNQVLVDVIESLKEVGFFVDDPVYADPNSPDGAVVVKASRGDQVMTAEIGLDERIKSDWQGIDGEYCTDAFFEYVRAMNGKGIEVIPDDANLKPLLKKKGEKDLPSSDYRYSKGER